MPTVVSDFTLVELGGERQFLVIRAKDMCQERLFKKNFFHSSLKLQSLRYLQIFVLYVDAKISLRL